jgi:DNA end-binding protein Ku
MATSVWRGYVSFGLISIPVQLFKAARAERVELRQVYRVSADQTSDEKSSREGSAGKGRQKKTKTPIEEAVVPVRRAATTGEAERILPDEKLLKGFEFEDGRFVTIEDEELKALETRTGSQMEVLEFVPLQAVDPVYFEASYYVRPEPGGEKSFALLFTALQRAGLVAVAQFAMHRREHVALIRSGRYGLIAHTMFYSTEVRGDEEYRTDTALLNPKEIALADRLVTSLTADFEPEKYRDSYKERLEALIAAKIDGKATSTGVPARTPAPVVDIMEALQASLSISRKPPAKAKVAEPVSRSKRKRSLAG